MNKMTFEHAENQKKITQVPVVNTFSGDYELMVTEKNPIEEKSIPYRFRVWGYSNGQTNDRPNFTIFRRDTLEEVMEEVMEFAEDILRESEEGQDFSGWTFHAESQNPNYNHRDYLIVKVHRS